MASQKDTYNRTLVEGIRTILLEKNLPEHLWAEALYHINYTFNSLPKSNDTKSPRDKYFNEHSKVEFIEFGHPVIFKSNKQNLSKLKAKGESGIFIGIDHNSKGYRIYANGKIEVRRNVRFLSCPLSKSSPIISQNDKNVEEPVTLRRSERIRQQNSLLTNTSHHYEPRTYKQAVNCPESQHWINAMKEELDSIEKNNTWSKVELPKDRKAIGSRWVFKLKCSRFHPNSRNRL